MHRRVLVIFPLYIPHRMSFSWQGKRTFNITDFGVSPELKDALDITTQMALQPGLLALKDAGIPLVAKYKPSKLLGKKVFDGWALPKKMRERTGVIFASAFQGIAILIKHLKKEDPSSSFDRRFSNSYRWVTRSLHSLSWHKHQTQVNAACAARPKRFSYCTGLD